MTPADDFHLSGEDLSGGRVKLNNSFSLSPLIPAKPTGKPVTFYGIIGGYAETKKKLIIRVGAVAKNRTRDDGAGLCPALHVELWHLILVLLSFWEERPDIGGATVRPSFGEVWRRFTCSNANPSKNQLEGFGRLLDELDALRMAVTIDGGDERIEDVVHYSTRRVRLNFGNVESVFDGFTFHEYFTRCLIYAERYQDVRLDVLARITSRYVRAAYLWLPAKASHHPHPKAASDPSSPSPEYLGEMAVMSSAEFMRNLGEPGLPRSRRKERLLQRGEKSILRQLHGLPMLRQHQRLGVSWWDSEDDLYLGTYAYHSEDWMPGASVAAWTDVGGAKQTSGNLLANFLAGDGDPRAYWHYLSDWKRLELDPFVQTRMTALGIKKIEEYMPLYKQVLAILGPDLFRDAVGALGEGSARKSDTGFLFRGILFEKVTTIARKRTEQYRREHPSG